MLAEQPNKRPPCAVPEHQVRDELKRILVSNGFFRAPRMRRFLTFVVEATLSAGAHSEDLKESVIGVNVFDRVPGYDPKTDPVVRVEARRLRNKLEEYYTTPDHKDAVCIEIPKGSYVPTFRRLQPETLPPPEPSPANLRQWVVAGFIALSAIALIAVLAFATKPIWRGWFTRSQLAGAVGIRSLAILPFRNLSGDSSKEYIAQGFTDELTTELARIQGLKVISRTSADQYRSTDKRLPQIARELNVDAIVEGTVLSLGQSVRVTAQLIRAATDTHLWAQSFERSGSDLPSLNGQIATSIAQQVGVALSPDAVSKPGGQQTRSTEAYQAYLKGRFFWGRRTLDSFNRAITYYKQAIELDPNYGKAYAALGDVYVLLSSYGGPSPAKSLFLAREAARKALALDSGLAEAHTVLAAVKIDDEWDWPGATREFQRAIQLSPGYPTAHHWYALHLSRLGQNMEAENEIKRALELDPLSLIILTDAAEVFYCARQPEESEMYLNRALELDPNFAEAHLVYGKVYELERSFPEAIEQYDEADRLFGHAPNVWALKGHAFALWGQRTEAFAMATQMEQASTQRYVSAVDIAITYCGLREHERLAGALEKAYKLRDKGVDIVNADPLFDRCRSDPAFRELLKEMKLGS